MQQGAISLPRQRVYNVLSGFTLHHLHGLGGVSTFARHAIATTVVAIHPRYARTICISQSRGPPPARRESCPTVYRRRSYRNLPPSRSCHEAPSPQTQSTSSPRIGHSLILAVLQWSSKVLSRTSPLLPPSCFLSALLPTTKSVALYVAPRPCPASTQNPGKA